MNFGIINDLTGFANGEEFESEAELRDYFTAENMLGMFGSDAMDEMIQDDLDEMCDFVLEKGWHFSEQWLFENGAESDDVF